jgi:hypothetical protein
VSIIHDITCGFVFTSGAGMSFAGPMMMEISLVKRRVMRSISPRLICDGSHTMPPLAPP